MVSDPFASVVVPVRDYAPSLARLLETLSAVDGVERIVVNGGFADETLKALARSRPDVRWIASPPGRGRQMNAGARAALGRWLVFVHADTRLPHRWREELEGIDGDRSVAGG